MRTCESTKYIRRLSLSNLWLLTIVTWQTCPAAEIQFNRDIRPILSDSCFPCHGPDEKNRQAELRLDLSESALLSRDGRRAIFPGNANASEVIQRITNSDPDLRMPPRDSGHAVTPEQVELLRRWITAGAKWERHWSLLSPVQPPLPGTKQTNWPTQPLDTFVLSRLEKEELQPAAQADQATLLRRISFDLTGLPPTPTEVATFLADQAPDAYERQVDRLLASPRYGERMAGPWLDAARYADTSGYQSDGERFMWRWRDWVIAAYNRNLPFDRFTIEQLAGDLLPNATLEQKIATGFHRNHRGNAEGGIIAEEYAAEYVADRVETTGTVWLGLTIGCARCHDHKFDPLPTRDFYSLAAFFNNVPEKGRAVKFGNSPPFIAAPTERQQEAQSQLHGRLLVANSQWHKYQPEVERAQLLWEKSDPAKLPPHYFHNQALVKDWTADDSRFNGERVFDAGDIADFGYLDKFTLSAWIWLDDEKSGGTIISRMTDVPHGDGYQFAVVGGKLQLNLVKRWLDDSTRVQTANKLQTGRWQHVATTYDGSRTAEGIRFYVNGQLQKNDVLLDEINQPINVKAPLRIGGGGGPAMNFRGQLRSARVDAIDLVSNDVAWLATAETLPEILKIEPAKRTAAQARKLREYYLTHHADERARTLLQRVQTLAQQARALQDSLPTVMVMEELPQPRETFVLLRGQYDQPGERVSFGVPGALPAWPNQAPNNRLGLARWLVSPTHPLTARVQVNRLWQLHFGTGLVKTAEDFGSQGEWPSHPELLDWLAVQWPAHGWDVKWLQRQMVTSSTYRQTSRTTPQRLELDPENRLLARGPRQRLSAEQLRDQALAASGMLVEEIGGPSVRPLQPVGLWKELTGVADYEPGQGADLVRRSLYTFWKRTIAPPNMTALDAPSREFCTVRSSRTNTPLQALTLLNETTFSSAATGLAERALARQGETDRERIAWAFQVCTSRHPTTQELEILTRGLHQQRQLSPGNEAAAHTALMRVLLNLDETLHRN
ncbi:Planctomycete cytochrome C [Anatilimnocola aggregata]|uniref:Planctomycete cytochrome C n=1 Tax=Anatilimnocola aggregata TaxID=2528021 RepID=A0A517Y776_9BACT|nr:DUF1553 domain-containing protein [Anatilimnocola aggregata]QDU26077.1 Planctomycete cytochrome C [Anatilimnocola aggregata]